MDNAELEAKAKDYLRCALDAKDESKAAAGAAKEAGQILKRSRAAVAYSGCQHVVAVTLFDATRQLLFERTGLDHFKTMTAYLAHLAATGEGELIMSTISGIIINGWILFLTFGATALDGVEIDRKLFDREKWVKDHTTPRAELSTLEFVLRDGFQADLLAKLKATGKSVNALVMAATGKGSGRVTVKQLKEEITNLKAAKQSEIAARGEELATTKAELAACKEQIKEKEDEIFNLALVVEPLKTQLAEVKNELAEVNNELAKEKDKNKTGRRQTAVSPLCDATNVRLTSSAA